jgi:hypothetical protein
MAMAFFHTIRVGISFLIPLSAISLLLLFRAGFLWSVKLKSELALPLISERKRTELAIVLLALGIGLCSFSSLTYDIRYAAVGVLVFLVSISQFIHKETWEITKDTVQKNRRNIFGNHSWSVPLSSYEATAYIRPGFMETEGELILVHPEKKYTFTLVSISEPEVYDIDQQKFSDLLGLPTISETAFRQRSKAA